MKLTLIKVIKEKWGQYFANYHFCTPLCSKRNGNLAIKNFLEQIFAKSSLINLAPNTWFNEKNAIKKGCAELVFWYCPYYALWLWMRYKNKTPHLIYSFNFSHVNCTTTDPMTLSCCQYIRIIIRDMYVPVLRREMSELFMDLDPLFQYWL